jgi:alpha-glucosidase
VVGGQEVFSFAATKMRASVSLLGLAASSLGSAIVRRQATTDTLNSCPGYTASNTEDHNGRFTADLSLAGAPCNAFGEDIADLKLEVEYQTESRLHVKIYDAAQQIYQVPESVFPRPSSDDVDPSDAVLSFSYETEPFSFAITREGTNESLFDTSAASFVFESQYLRLRTKLPSSPSLYGLGEHTDPFQLNTTNYTRTASTGIFTTLIAILTRVDVES